MKTVKTTMAPCAVAALTAFGLLVPAALALPPAPANDSPLAPEVIGPATPIIVYGTSVLAANDINDSGGALPSINSYMDGPDVFYSFTPNSTATYRIGLAPWHHAPLRSSDRRFTIYVQDSLDTFIDGIRAPGNARPVFLDIALTAGETYRIGVDHNDQTHDNFKFTLFVDELNLANPDTCASAETLPSSVPVLRMNDIDGASADYVFSQDGGRCSVSGSTPTTAPGPDHVYYFSPPYDGDFAIELVYSGFAGVIYVDDSCPPFFGDGCLGASNHSTSGTSGGKHELVVVTLQGGKDYWIFVDDHSTSYITGNYALIVDDAYNYEINELEPNDTYIEATPLTMPLNGGQLVGPLDEDWYAVTGLTGDRVYCWVNNGGSANSTLDTDVAFYAADGTTLIEFDDEDGDGADAPIEDLRYIYSSYSPVIAGAQMTSDGTHYFQVTDQSDTGTVDRYRFHVGVEPATRNPLAECEPNDTIELADYTGKHYYSGVIPTTDDSDFYAFEAEVGDRVFVAFDGDPERDSTGSDSANTDPNAFHGKLVIYDPDGDILISDISDSNSVQSPPDYPAQGGFFVARTAGTHYVEVMPQSSASQVGPTETYNLAIFINDQAPVLIEDIDPVVTLVPDYVNDVIAGTAVDNQPGDSGICDVSLAANDNLQITNISTVPAGVVTFDIELVDPMASGSAKLIVADCAGNTACEVVSIDIDTPLCEGVASSRRQPFSLHGPIHVPDYDSTGIDGTIDIAEAGIITDVNVTVNIETLSCSGIDCWLESPAGTRVELMTDRGGSSGIDFTGTTFDDDAAETIPSYGGTPPFTGVWLPEDSAGLAQLNGEQAQGTWKLNVVDDSSYPGGGSRLVSWSLDVTASFSAPQSFAGTASDAGGIASIVLTDAVNTQLNLPPDFTPGDTVVDYTVALIDDTQDGSGTVIVTDVQDNTCESIINLNGAVDTTDPANTGSVTTDITFAREVLSDVPLDTPVGLIDTVSLSDSMLIGEVEVDVTIDSKDTGRVTSTLTHTGDVAVLLNRTGMDERFSVGNTKDGGMECYFDDDQPQDRDVHLEPALGSQEMVGMYQPDGRGEYITNGITTDDRDNMLFVLAGADSTGDYDMYVADYRPGYASTSTTCIFRRWSATVKNPCGPDRYVGQATDFYPGSGICSIGLAGGATNLTVDADFVPGAELVDYVVKLVDPTLPGSGDLEITDCTGNTTVVPISLEAEADDQTLPVLAGAVNMGTFQFEGTASDDGGIYAVEMAPYADNLQIVSTAPAMPNGETSVDFVVGLIDPLANGRGYVRAVDGCGLRGYTLVEIDAQPPVCTGSVGNTSRYLSTDLPQDIPDNNSAGVSSSILVPDTDIVEDVNITFNITHPAVFDIDMTLTSPTFIDLFSDRGSTGNDFIDTTLDDEADEVIPSSSSAAPFTGSWQPENGSLSLLDGVPAAGTYTLKVVDDHVNYTGTFENWALTIESSTFPPRFNGRAEDGQAHDSGICTIELLPGSFNLALAVDPFDPGDSIVRYSVAQFNPVLDGVGTVRVTDCAGNFCDTPIMLLGSALNVELDIKPGSCPNAFNRGSNGVLPVGVLGLDDFDVTMIDVSTVRISRLDGMGGEAAPNDGPPGPSPEIKDVGTPFDGVPCACHELEGDGIDDLFLKFRTEDVVEALELDTLPSGDLVVLVVTGQLFDGTMFAAADCVRLVPPGTPPGMVEFQSNVPGAWIGAAPLDLQLDGGGFADFQRTYPLTTEVSLTAESSYAGKRFVGWRLDGAFATAQLSAGLVVGDAVHTIKALFLRIGDMDGNESIDLNDFATFATCFQGPSVSTPPNGCSREAFAAGDLDSDGDVDLTDFAIFADNYGS